MHVIMLFFWGCEFRKLLYENPGLKNELISNPCLKNFPINIRDAMYGCRTEARVKQGEEISYVDVISLYPYISKEGKFSCHPKMYVGAECPPDCLDMESIIKYKNLPPKKLVNI